MILGIGTDIIELGRIQSIGVERLIKRILTQMEQEHMPQLERRKLEYLAGRFAAKEAISKAAGTGIGQAISFSDIEISSNEKGAPQVTLSDQVMQTLFGKRQVRVHLSISHSEHYATAMAIIEDVG